MDKSVGPRINDSFNLTEIIIKDKNISAQKNMFEKNVSIIVQTDSNIFIFLKYKSESKIICNLKTEFTQLLLFFFEKDGYFSNAL